MKVHVTVIIVLIIAYMFFSLKSKSNYEEVPKIIHQTAMSDKSKWNPIWERCQQSWKDKFPDFEYRMWTDEDLENLVKTDFSWFYDTWKGYDKNIKRIDSARYCILYKHGGMYVDMDFECLENFWDQIPMDKVSIAGCAHTPVGFENALMVSPKEHPFWELVFSQLFRLKDENVFKATGPQLIDGAAEQYEINKLDRLQFSSADPSDKTKYAIHRQTGQWIGKD
jgi:mannosyltransferase OCH1-like enzyme